MIAFMLVPITGEAMPGFSWMLVCGMGLASAAIQFTMNWAQESVSPTRATVIYVGEPIWADVVGRIAGERMPALALVGAALMVAGVIVSELEPERNCEN